MITQQTATDIAMLYRDIQAAEELREKVCDAIDRLKKSDIRDLFGRRHDYLEMGIPSGDRSSTILRVPFELALPVIDATIASHRAKLELLNHRVMQELTAADLSGQQQAEPA